MLEGIIIKGVGGNYYVKTASGVLECRARGLFRKQKIKPLIGDKVMVEVIDGDKAGYIKEIKDRDNQLVRPTVANVSQAIIVFAIINPAPNLWLLDRFLINAEKNNIDALVCINKIDLAKDEEVNNMADIYRKAGYKVLCTSIKKNIGISALRECLKGNITVFAGPSGVGKSSLLNMVEPGLKLTTGDISKKTNRGKHTTRSTKLLELETDGWVVDTPGFSALDIDNIKEEELKDFFIDIKSYSYECRFNSCMHINEPDCRVKEAVENGEISKERYQSYLRFMQEIKQKRRY
ncbi:ribosome small subunit-dependent GTPase A [Clostridiaceae bacterium M8S5]|nr:ribosome small subunit-dependent GTPase A [Clostridiaceae bacterium M8S5]